MNDAPFGNLLVKPVLIIAGSALVIGIVLGQCIAPKAHDTPVVAEKPDAAVSVVETTQAPEPKCDGDSGVYLTLEGRHFSIDECDGLSLFPPDVYHGGVAVKAKADKWLNDLCRKEVAQGHWKNGPNGWTPMEGCKAEMGSSCPREVCTPRPDLVRKMPRVGRHLKITDGDVWEMRDGRIVEVATSPYGVLHGIEFDDCGNYIKHERGTEFLYWRLDGVSEAVSGNDLVKRRPDVPPTHTYANGYPHMLVPAVKARCVRPQQATSP